MNVKLMGLLEILETEVPVSGEELAEKMGISRTMVWKYVKQLKSMGFNIDACKAQGYRLSDAFIPLNEKRLKAELMTYDADLELCSVIDSTNSYVMRTKNTKPVFICIAEQQLEGRGRRGRKWSSPFGQNIYLSLRFKYYGSIRDLQGLSPMVGIQLSTTLHSLGFKDVGLKWPNDLIAKDKKLGGVLIEIAGEANDCFDVIVGFGLNANMKAEVEKIEQPWTSLAELNNRAVDRNDIIIALLRDLLPLLMDYDEQLVTKALQTWNKFDVFQGEQVRLIRGDEVIKGESQGINERGELILLHADGSKKTYSIGELSLRAADGTST